MTLREIKDRVLLNVGEVGNDDLELAVKQEVNKALNHIALVIDLPNLRRTSVITLGVGSYVYDLTTLGRVRQVLAVVRKRTTGSENLHYLPSQTMREAYGDPSWWTSGDPFVWTIEGTNLLVYPKPASTTNLFLLWLAWPEPLVEDLDEVDDRISGIVVSYATAMLHLSLENLDAHRTWINIAVGELERLKADINSPSAFHNVQGLDAPGSPPYYLDPFNKGVY